METLIISNSRITAEFITAGAELTSLKTTDGHEYLWQGDPAYWSGQSPLLFPIIGALQDDSYTVGGKTYSMKSHGFARKSEWTVDNKSGSSITFSLKSGAETLKVYPFAFRLSVIYSVGDSMLKVEYRVENPGTEQLPFQIGGHPAFNCPLEDGMKLSDYKLVFEKNENSRRLLKTDLLTGETESFFENGNTVELTHGLFDRGAIIFRDLKSDAVTLERKDGKGRKITLRYPGFTHFGIWKKPETDAPFICLEPWFGVDSAVGDSRVFTGKEGIIILEPGETFQSEYSIELE